MVESHQPNLRIARRHPGGQIFRELVQRFRGTTPIDPAAKWPGRLTLASIGKGRFHGSAVLGRQTAQRTETLGRQCVARHRPRRYSTTVHNNNIILPAYSHSMTY